MIDTYHVFTYLTKDSDNRIEIMVHDVLFRLKIGHDISMIKSGAKNELAEELSDIADLFACASRYVSEQDKNDLHTP